MRCIAQQNPQRVLDYRAADVRPEPLRQRAGVTADALRDVIGWTVVAVASALLFAIAAWTAVQT